MAVQVARGCVAKQVHEEGLEFGKRSCGVSTVSDTNVLLDASWVEGVWLCPPLG